MTIQSIAATVTGSVFDNNNGSEAETTLENAKGSQVWRIVFAPHADMLATGNEPYHILRELMGLGSCEVKADLSKIPSLSDINPEQCYIIWTITLTTDHTKEDILEVFDFVEGLCDLSLDVMAIEPKTSETKDVKLPNKTAEKEPATANTATGSGYIRGSIIWST